MRFWLSLREQEGLNRRRYLFPIYRSSKSISKVTIQR
jgi:hypothetical protein